MPIVIDYTPAGDAVQLGINRGQYAAGQQSFTDGLQAQAQYAQQQHAQQQIDLQQQQLAAERQYHLAQLQGLNDYRNQQVGVRYDSNGVRRDVGMAGVDVRRDANGIRQQQVDQQGNHYTSQDQVAGQRADAYGQQVDQQGNHYANQDQVAGQRAGTYQQSVDQTGAYQQGNLNLGQQRVDQQGTHFQNQNDLGYWREQARAMQNDLASSVHQRRQVTEMMTALARNNPQDARLPDLQRQAASLDGDIQQKQGAYLQFAQHAPPAAVQPIAQPQNQGPANLPPSLAASRGQVSMQMAPPAPPSAPAPPQYPPEALQRAQQYLAQGYDRETIKGLLMQEFGNLFAQ